jgi:DNA-binding CsgD family transcriptional regulator
VAGRLRVHAHRSDGAHAMLIVRVAKAAGPAFSRLPEGESTALVRVLRGEQQKVVASDLRLSCAAISARCARGLARFGVTSASVPLIVVLAAQSWTGAAETSGWSVAFEREGHACLLLGAPRLVSGLLPSLTPAEEDVAQLLVDGFSRREVAIRRATSMHTIAGQTHSIFTKLGVSGRYALVRRVAQSMFRAWRSRWAPPSSWRYPAGVPSTECSFGSEDAARQRARNTIETLVARQSESLCTNARE